MITIPGAMKEVCEILSCKEKKKKTLSMEDIPGLEREVDGRILTYPQ